MPAILREYMDGEFKVTEFTQDGKTVSSRASVLANLPTPEPPKTLEERVAQLQQDNVILMDALATAFEEILMLREDIAGGTV